jgi:hypothetical protein
MIRRGDPILCPLVWVAVLAMAGCSQTVPSVEPGGTVELARKMDFYFLQDWSEGRDGQLRPEYLLVPADSEDARLLLNGVVWEVGDCITIVESRVAIPPGNPRIKWKSQVTQDHSVRYSVEGLRIEVQATISAGQECAPGEYPIVLKMPGLGIAAEFLDAGVFFPGKNKPDEWNPPDTLVVATLQVK